MEREKGDVEMMMEQVVEKAEMKDA